MARSKQYYAFKRFIRIQFCATFEEDIAMRTAAEKAGLSKGKFIRDCVLGVINAGGVEVQPAIHTVLGAEELGAQLRERQERVAAGPELLKRERSLRTGISTRRDKQHPNVLEKQPPESEE